MREDEYIELLERVHCPQDTKDKIRNQLLSEVHMQEKRESIKKQDNTTETYIEYLNSKRKIRYRFGAAAVLFICLLGIAGFFLVTGNKRRENSSNELIYYVENDKVLTESEKLNQTAMGSINKEGAINSEPTIEIQENTAYYDEVLEYAMDDNGTFRLLDQADQSDQPTVIRVDPNGLVISCLVFDQNKTFILPMDETSGYSIGDTLESEVTVFTKDQIEVSGNCTELNYYIVTINDAEFVLAQRKWFSEEETGVKKTDNADMYYNLYQYDGKEFILDCSYNQPDENGLVMSKTIPERMSTNTIIQFVDRNHYKFIYGMAYHYTPTELLAYYQGLYTKEYDDDLLRPDLVLTNDKLFVTYDAEGYISEIGQHRDLTVYDLCLLNQAVLTQLPWPYLTVEDVKSYFELQLLQIPYRLNVTDASGMEMAYFGYEGIMFGHNMALYDEEVEDYTAGQISKVILTNNNYELVSGIHVGIKEEDIVDYDLDLHVIEKSDIDNYGEDSRQIPDLANYPALDDGNFEAVDFDRIYISYGLLDGMTKYSDEFVYCNQCIQMILYVKDGIVTAIVLN